MIWSLLISLNAMACVGGGLAPLVLAPTKNYSLEIDKAQEIILDGSTQLPKITSVKGTGPKGKPMLTVMSGLQVLEKGQMKSYPHRISIKMNEVEKELDKPVEIAVESQGKPSTITVKWAQSKSDCFKPVVK